MFFDVVLMDKTPLFNDTPEKVREYVEENYDHIKHCKVISGDSIKPISVDEYLSRKP
jgi:CRISPR/Cas system-associated protein Cas7 (RAMP superfamily)